MRWLVILLLAAFALTFTAMQAKSEAIDTTQVYYECPTAALAEEVAVRHDELVFATSPLPHGCYWVYGERQADVLELIKPVYLKDGSVVWVGKVQRKHAPEAYSAGRIEQEMV